jgi:hypothetical protein
MSLSSLIVQREVASIRQVEEALARQVLYGADLVTNLMEVVQIPEAVLVPLLAESVGLPAAPVGMLPPPSVQARALVPEEVAVHRLAMPLSVDGDRLTLAVCDPMAPDVLEEVSFELGVRIDQCVAPAVRIREALARVYGVPLDRRMARLVGRLAGIDTTVPNSLPPVSLPRVDIPPLPEALIHDLPQLNPPGMLSLDVMCFSDPDVPADERDLAPPAPERIDPEPAAATVESSPPSLLRASKPPPELPRRRGPLTLEQFTEEIVEAADREAILQLFFDFGRQFFEYSAIFVVHGDLAEGRDAFGSGAPRDRVVAIGVPLDIPSFLHAARGRASTLCTFPDASGLDAVLMADLRRDARSQVLVVPVVVRSRAVAFFVADDGATGISPSAQADVTTVATLAGRQFERLIVRMKLQGLTGVAAPKEQRVEPQPAEPPPRSYRDASARKAAMQALGQALVDSTAPSTQPQRAAPLAPAPQPAPPPPPPPELVEQPAPPTARGQAHVTRPLPPPPPLPPSSRRRDTLQGHPAVSPEPPSVEPAAPFPSAPETRPETPAAKVPPPLRGSGLSSTLDARWDASELELADDAHTPVDEAVVPFPQAGRPGEELALEPGPDGPGLERALFGELSDRPPPPQTAAVRRPSGPPLPREETDDEDTPASSDRFVPHETPSRPPPADLRQARLLRSIDALTAQFVNSEPASRTPAPPPSEVSVTLPPHHPPPSRTLKPLPSVIVDMTGQIDRLTETFLSNPKDEQVEAELLRIGQPAMPSIMKHFPGPITIMRDTLDDSWPRVTECGPILRLIAGQRRVALPFVLSRIEDPDTETRFWATFLLTELAYPDAIPAAVARLFDDSKRVRRAARLVAHVLGDTAPAALVAELDRIVGDPKATPVRRVVTIDALGEMRDPLVVPILLGALSYDDEDIGIAVRRALVLVTRQDFGRDTKKWLAWWRESSSRHRIEWLIDALTHDLPALRRAAGQELKALTEEYFGYYDDLPKKDRERAQQHYREWWKNEGQARFRPT